VKGWEVARLGELRSVPGPGTLRWTPLRRHFGVTAFGVNAYTASEAGQDVVEEHTEETLGHEELYVVVAGSATFVLDGEEVPLPTGGAVFLRDPRVRRYARADEPGTTVLAVGGQPGAHEVSAWEYVFTAYAHADAGDVERGLAELDAGLAERPEHPPLLYHRACLLARDGRLDEARRALERALELNPALRERAAQDEDLLALGVAGEP